MPRRAASIEIEVGIYPRELNFNNFSLGTRVDSFFPFVRGVLSIALARHLDAQR
jgi:hypothetical protein